MMNLLMSLMILLPAAWVVYSRWSASRRRGLPPGPPPLPIVGNIFQLGKNPHKSLSQLAKTYGPLMSLKLGTQFTVVASSPEMAREILQKQSHVSSRSNPAALYVHGHEEFSMVMLPASSQRWKKLRRIAREQLFSNQALQATKDLRHESLRKLIDHVSSCSGTAMNVGVATFTTMSNLMFATLFSTELVEYGSESGNEFKEHVDLVSRYMGVPNISDFFPILAPIDPQGIRRKMSYHLGCMMEIVQGLIEKRLEQRNPSSSTSNYQRKSDFLETLLDLMEGDDYDLSIQEIKHLCLDLIGAGSDTSAATTEWAMVELLLHPQKMAKLKAELNSVVRDKRIIEESDISKLPYLQATVKEVLRYHPISPLLFPRLAEEEMRVNGYIIPKNSKVIVNFWAVTRIPSVWKDPESFEPERFLGNDIGYQGQYFELIPFGSGRRICPGMALASRMLECMVGTLCHNFDWKLEEGADSKTFQREDVFGLALQKKIPLRAIPIKV